MTTSTTLAANGIYVPASHTISTAPYGTLTTNNISSLTTTMISSLSNITMPLNYPYSVGISTNEINLQDLLKGQIDYNENIIIYSKEIDEILMWRIIIWAYINGDEYKDYALLTDNQNDKNHNKNTLHYPYKLLAFGSKKTYDFFDKWMNDYNTIFGCDSVLPQPDSSYISGFMVKTNFTFTTAKKIEKELLKQWAWISQNCKEIVMITPQYWIFKNKNEAVHFKLTIDEDKNV